MNYRTKHGDDFEIYLRDGDIDIYTSHGASLTVCTPDEADSIAVHLIQASTSDDDVDNHGEVSSYLRALPKHLRTSLGLALIRSAR